MNEKELRKCSFLKVLCEATLRFSGSLYPTLNLYFPQILGIHLNLVKTKASHDEYRKKIATQMWTKLSKYLVDFNFMLVIVMVFDPRSKFSLLSLAIKSPSQLKKIEDALLHFFYECIQASRQGSVGNVGGGSGDINYRQVSVENVEGGSKNIILEKFDEYNNDDLDSTKKSQLQYMYPKLAKLAMDIRCVSLSTVASESTFSLSGRVLNIIVS
uniref:HAT C-terminal dimerisation domain-containing protein n=1 Tax=Lactuca sativa TaxID=4236 RepID=A0A9R1WGI9_LACSA|nr:hypothetical protein LSAT_V11C200081600 [Lactuca sativa]